MKKGFHKVRSMRERMLFLLLLSAVAIVGVSALVSLTLFQFSDADQTQESMKFLLKQIGTQIDQSYMAMINLMDQMAPGGETGNLVTEYLEETEAYEKYKLRRNLERNLLGSTFINSYINQICYYDPQDGTVFLENGFGWKYTEVKEAQEQIKNVGNNVFFGVRPSDNLYDDSLVVSMLQTGNCFAGKRLDIYIEMKLNIASEIEEAWSMVQTDKDKRICYSSSDAVEKGQYLPDSMTELEEFETGSYGEYYVIALKSQMDIYHVLMLPESVLKEEENLWKLRIVIVGICSFIAFYMVILAIYRMIGKPLRKLEEEIEKTGDGNFGEIECNLGIAEFNQVLYRISEMRKNIRKLKEEIKAEEKERIAVETEKLMYQINPHFLLNALYSVQWMAQNEGQIEIRSFVHDLISILAYNLGKESQTSSLRDEIAIAEKYISIQKSRYDFEVDFQIEEGEYLDSRTIRMLLQPVIENTLQHGLGSEGRMEIRIFYTGESGYAVIVVQDHGAGLSGEKLAWLNQPLGREPNSGEKKSGIGLRYVRYMLERFYEGKGSLTINSTRGKGTKVTILLPIQEEIQTGGDDFDSCIDS